MTAFSDKTRAHSFILAVLTVWGIALAGEAWLEGWEFWVPPLMIFAAAVLWVLHISQKLDEQALEMSIFLYGVFAALFHGMHETSFFDVAVAIMMLLGFFSFLNRSYMLNLILGEYAVIMIVQLGLVFSHHTIVFDSLNISRLMMQICAVLCIYVLSRVSVKNRLEAIETLEKRDKEIDHYDSDMEDFLSNISHELRTPVNVVNGMSTLLSKKAGFEEVDAIKDAGIRLSYQIEDIQDYTEIKQNRVVLEEENYMFTSLINDVVSGLRLLDIEGEELEFVVDIDPAIPSVMKGDIRKLHKLFRHLLENAVKFTKAGGIYIRANTIQRPYGVNLCIEVSDTGRGMSRKDIEGASQGLYQADKARDRSTGGVGLGLSIVYGLTHRMKGFVKIESEKGRGTTVRVTVPQQVIDATPCLRIESFRGGDILFHVKQEKYKVPKVRDFYRNMAVNLAVGLKCSLYSTQSTREVDNMLQKLNVGYIFMGQEEYEADAEYFDRLSLGDIVVAVSAHAGFRLNPGSGVLVMPKPLYGFPVTKVLNEGKEARNLEITNEKGRPFFEGARVLVVDDEPMNLVVATGLFRDYRMETETAGSGRQAIEKCAETDYDVIFMDHMMPEMDGVEAMKRIREEAKERGRKPVVVALTANAVSGAREMFLAEGFDGFIAKPININDFERVMKHVLPDSKVKYHRGGRS
ncbi:MAG: response regulator [Lachnospiraceae bacterium]|nr:response regulator [Lachnospiraceae bacterium]